MKITVKRRSRRPLIASLITILLLIIAGGAVWLVQERHKNEQERQAQQVTQQTPPVATSSPEEPPETPTRITIETIDVDASIVPLGLTETGMMDDPDSNELVGWYDKSARIGEDSFAMLLDGHYGIGDDAAVFRRLPELTLGDIITIHGEHGIAVQYKIVETEQQYTQDVDMKKAFFAYKRGVESLTIITCEGEFLPNQGTYDKRTIVYAVRAS